MELSFPECSKDCEKIKLLGAGECENVCPEKFTGKVRVKQMIKEEENGTNYLG